MRKHPGGGFSPTQRIGDCGDAGCCRESRAALSPAQHLARLCLGTGGPNSFEDLAPAAIAMCLDAQPGAWQVRPRHRAPLPQPAGRNWGGTAFWGDSCQEMG